MSEHICPWWLGYLLASPLRKWMGQDPMKILRPYVREGMTVLEPGPGMGFFTLPLAQLVAPSGRVIAVDVQSKMITSMKRRAAKAGVLDRIDPRVAASDTLGVDDLAGKVDFALAFAVVHEFPDAKKLFAEIAAASKPDAQLLVAEPSGHVNEKKFEDEVKAALATQFMVSDRPSISRSHAVLLTRK